MNRLITPARSRFTAKKLWGIILCLLCSMSLPGSNSFASQAGRAFNDADAELNKAYQAVLATVTDAHQRALFVKAQKAWIKYRDDNVAFMAEFDPESKGGLFLNIDLMEARTAFLKRLLTKPSP